MEPARIEACVDAAAAALGLPIAPATPCGAPLIGSEILELNRRRLPMRASLGLLTQPISFIGLPVCAAPVAGVEPAPLIGVQIRRRAMARGPRPARWAPSRARGPGARAGRASGGSVMSVEVNRPDVVAEVAAVFARYEDALVHNNADVLDALFWHSRSTVRYGVGENLVGTDAIRAFRAARPSKGLARTLRTTVITTFGSDFATVSTEFERAGSAGVGRQSQTWVRFEGGWCVVAAHISVLAP
jgi:hypothetical protein